MKNLHTFTDFLNEGKYAKSAGYPLSDLEDDADESTYEIMQIIFDELGDDAYVVDSEGEEDDAYEAAEDAFSKGSQKTIPLPAGGIGGPFLSYNKKQGIIRFDDHGFTAFYFTPKSKF